MMIMLSRITCSYILFDARPNKACLVIITFYFFYPDNFHSLDELFSEYPLMTVGILLVSGAQLRCNPNGEISLLFF